MENINNIADYKKTVKIYKSHNLANGFISINYAYIFRSGCVSGEHNVKIEKVGTPYQSLAFYHGLRL
jgi:hypothetical protein